MMSIKLLHLSTLEIVHYYKNDENENNGLKCFGQGRLLLNLPEIIGSEQFEKLLKGIDPNFIEGEVSRSTKKMKVELIKSNSTGKARAATDLTFTVPKSVSIALMLAFQHDKKFAIKLSKIIEESVLKVLDFIEKELLYIRKSNVYLQTNNCIFILRNHHLNRENQANEHYHCLAMNLSYDHDKKQWRALQNKKLFSSKKLLGALFRADLAARIRSELKMNIICTDAKNGFFELDMPSKIIKRFSTRRMKILQEITNLEKRYPVMSKNKLSQIATYSTRGKKSINVDFNLIVSEHITVAKECGYKKIDFLNLIHSNHLMDSSPLLDYSILYGKSKEAKLRDAAIKSIVFEGLPLEALVSLVDGGIHKATEEVSKNSSKGGEENVEDIFHNLSMTVESTIANNRKKR